MTNTAGAPGTPLRVAVIGSGPSGFYAAEALLESGLDVEVDLLERLPVPYGLVRFGVAPDHPKLKSVTTTFAQIAAHPRLRFFGNVEMGRDVSVVELGHLYHAVIVATGADGDRRIGIPGEDLTGVHAARDFVAWYNGRPGCESMHFDLSHDTAVIVGQGNVAVDVCRVLAKPVDALRGTDMAEHALDALARSRVREIHLVGRRGPVQASFTPKELRELGMIDGWQPVVDPKSLELNEASRAELADPARPHAAKNLAVLAGFAQAPTRAGRRIHLHFQQGPTALHGRGRLERVDFRSQRLEGPSGHQIAVTADSVMSLYAGLLFRSIGYRGTPLPGLPFDKLRGTLPHREGRVLDEHGSVVSGWFTAGWIKRGPTGIIGTNRACGVETVASLLADLPSLPRSRPGRAGLEALLCQKRHRAVTFAEWQAIEHAERERGRHCDKPAEKFVRVEEMLEVAWATGMQEPV